jgi:hypothetical protein
MKNEGVKGVIKYIQEKFSFLLSLGFTFDISQKQYDLAITYNKGEYYIIVDHDFYARDYLKGKQTPHVILKYKDYHATLLSSEQIFGSDKLIQLKPKVFQEDIFNQINYYADFVQENLDSFLSFFK